MNVGTPCGAAGAKLVKNTDSGDMAWVDIQGYKHSFPEGTKMSSFMCSNEYSGII